MATRAIDVKGLRKSYKNVEAVRGIDLHVEVGEVFALLGPNGAGKTTTVEILEGYRKRDAGEIHVLGHDPGRNERSLKERIGIVLQETSVDRFFTVREIIELFGGYYPNPLPVDDVIEVVGLTEKANERIRQLSGGQQRRLDVALGLAGNPELLFLDEPTTGFDPSARRNAWQMVKNLQSLGKTVFLTTHYMDEAQYLADRVVVIAKGEIVAEGPPDALGGRDVAGTKISFTLPPHAPPLPAEIAGHFQLMDSTWRCETDTPLPVLNDLTRWALDNEVGLRQLQVLQPTLEDVYLSLTGSENAQTKAEEANGSRSA